MRFKISDTELVQAIKKSSSMRALLMSLGLSPTKGNYDTCWERIKLLDIDTAHWQKPQPIKKGVVQYTYTLEEILVENSPYKSNCGLKRKLIKNGLIKYSCSECGCNGLWNNKRLVLVLDHINGRPRDNRIENLRFLCPNCNSQQDTFAGKNIGSMRRSSRACKNCGVRISKKRYYHYDQMCRECKPPMRRKKKKTFCVKCSTPVAKNSMLCWKCYASKSDSFTVTAEELQALVYSFSNAEIGEKYGVSRYVVACKCKKFNIRRRKKKSECVSKCKLMVSKQELEKLVWEMATEKIGKMFGVSGKAIEKRCKKLGISKPPRGYWAKKAAGKIQ